MKAEFYIYLTIELGRNLQSVTIWKNEKADQRKLQLSLNESKLFIYHLISSVSAKQQVQRSSIVCWVRPIEDPYQQKWLRQVSLIVWIAIYIT